MSQQKDAIRSPRMVNAHRNGRVLNRVLRLSNARIPSDWEQISRLAPHKVFLWSADGVYVDCSFPNSVYGHFRGGETVLGARIKDVLPSRAAATVMQGIHEVLRTGQSRKTVIELMWNTTGYRAEIQLIPLHQHVLGLVTDRPRQHPLRHKAPPGLIASVRQRIKVAPASALTKREWEVLCAYRVERTNRQMGEILGITERTVKFHFTNILHKLQIPSRRHLPAVGHHSSVDKGTASC